MAVLIDRSVTFRGATALLCLFLVPFFVSTFFGQQINRITIIVLSSLYGVLAIGQIGWHYRKAWRVIKDGLVTPFDRLSDDPESRR